MKACAGLLQAFGGDVVDQAPQALQTLARVVDQSLGAKTLPLQSLQLVRTGLCAEFGGLDTGGKSCAPVTNLGIYCGDLRVAHAFVEARPRAPVAGNRQVAGQPEQRLAFPYHLPRRYQDAGYQAAMAGDLEFGWRDDFTGDIAFQLDFLNEGEGHGDQHRGGGAIGDPAPWHIGEAWQFSCL